MRLVTWHVDETATDRTTLQNLNRRLMETAASLQFCIKFCPEFCTTHQSSALLAQKHHGVLRHAFAIQYLPLRSEIHLRAGKIENYCNEHAIIRSICQIPLKRQKSCEAQNGSQQGPCPIPGGARGAKPEASQNCQKLAATGVVYRSYWPLAMS